MLRTHLTLALLLTVTSCSKKEAPDDSAKAGGSSAAASAAQKPPPPAKVEVVLPPVKIEGAAPQEIGGKKLSAEPCKLDKRGAEMKHESFDDGLRHMVVSSDGAFYLLDHEGKVRRYLLQSASPCELQLDGKFGQGGIVTVSADAKEAEDFDKLALDAKGNVYVSGFVAKAMRISPDGKVSPQCSESGRLLIDPTSGEGYMSSKRVKLSDGACETSELKLEGWGDFGPKAIDVAAGEVFVEGRVDEIDKVAAYKHDGTRTALVGDKEGDGDLCFVQGAQPCNLGVCVLDSNCRRVRIWGRDGKITGAVELGNLLGTFYPWPTALVVTKDAAYISLTHQGEKDDKHHYGMVFRITGLN